MRYALLKLLFFIIFVTFFGCSIERKIDTCSPIFIYEYCDKMIYDKNVIAVIQKNKLNKNSNLELSKKWNNIIEKMVNIRIKNGLSLSYISKGKVNKNSNGKSKYFGKIIRQIDETVKFIPNEYYIHLIKSNFLYLNSYAKAYMVEPEKLETTWNNPKITGNFKFGGAITKFVYLDKNKEYIADMLLFRKRLLNLTNIFLEYYLSGNLNVYYNYEVDVPNVDELGNLSFGRGSIDSLTEEEIELIMLHEASHLIPFNPILNEYTIFFINKYQKYFYSNPDYSFPLIAGIDGNGSQLLFPNNMINPIIRASIASETIADLHVLFTLGSQVECDTYYNLLSKKIVHNFQKGRLDFVRYTCKGFLQNKKYILLIEKLIMNMELPKLFTNQNIVIQKFKNSLELENYKIFDFIKRENDFFRKM